MQDVLDVALELHALYPTPGAWYKTIHARLIDKPHWNVYEPRNVTTPNGYLTSKAVGASLYSTVYDGVATAEIKSLQVTMLSAAYQVLASQVPIYYVSENLARAVAATELPKDMRLSDLHFPMPGFVLGFPSRFLQEYLGYDCGYINVANLESQVPIPSPKGSSLPDIVVPKAKLVWQWHRWHRGCMEAYVGGYWRNDFASAVVTDYPYTDYTGAQGPELAANQASVDQVSLLVIKLLAVLAMRDGLITPGRMSRPARFKHGVKCQSEMWEPNFIGQKYQPKHESGTDGHASPHMHWRRGHHTYQVIGRREDVLPISALPRSVNGEINWQTMDEATRSRFWSSHKRIWIDPTLVSA